MITAKQYEDATGAAPEDDDMDRANCTKAGEIGHIQCGWCEVHQQPYAILLFSERKLLAKNHIWVWK